jgi:hypothetical protein
LEWNVKDKDAGSQELVRDVLYSTKAAGLRNLK